MAGIGFVLKKLSKQKNLMGLAKAYGHSAIISTGPWIFTVIALGIIVSVSGQFLKQEELLPFKVIVIYNFSFSLVLTGPIVMIATRYIADQIFLRLPHHVLSVLYGSLVVLYVVQLPLVIWFYFGFSDLSYTLAISAVVNYMLISTIWLVTVYSTAMKEYNSVTFGFIVGLLVSIIASYYFGRHYSVAGVINGFSIGLSIIIAIIISRILAEYPYKIEKPFKFLPYFVKYWPLLLSGFLYNAATWADKWVLWSAPNAIKTSSGFYINPDYDSAMFLAYLSIVPAMAAFIFSIETNFYEKYVIFYRDIADKATYRKIQTNHKSIMDTLIFSGTRFLAVQGTLTVVLILASPKIIELLKISPLQTAILRYGFLGVFFHLMILFSIIVLAYFDNRKAAVYIQLLFLITNVVFSYITVQLGFSYYGVGYALSTIVTATFAVLITAQHVVKLPYHSFITTNESA
jgi:uncharacterized membrane protein